MGFSLKYISHYSLAIRSFYFLLWNVPYFSSHVFVIASYQEWEGSKIWFWNPSRLPLQGILFLERKKGEKILGGWFGCLSEGKSAARLFLLFNWFFSEDYIYCKYVKQMKAMTLELDWVRTEGLFIQIYKAVVSSIFLIMQCLNYFFLH